MTNGLTQAEHDVIETLIDRYKLSVVLEAVADICEDKSQHIRYNWQDATLSHAWNRAAHAVQKVAISPTVKDVSL